MNVRFVCTTNGESPADRPSLAFVVKELSPSLMIALGLAACVAIASTTGLGISGSWFDEQRILITAAFWAAGACHLVRGIRDDGLALRTLTAALVLGAISALVAARPYLAIVEWSTYCMFAAIVLGGEARSERALRITAAVAPTAVAACYAAGVLSNYIASLMLGFPVGAETLLVGFSNPRFPAQLETLVIPFLPLAFWSAPGRAWRAALVLVAIVIWMCLIGSGSRTSWIALASTSLFALWFGREGLGWTRLQLAFAFGGLILWLSLFFGVPAMTGTVASVETGRFTNFASVGHRWELWLISLDNALNRPLLGAGPMHFAYVDNGSGAHPHNFWLQLAGEWGIPATVVVGSVVLGFFARMIKTVRADSDSTSRRLGVSLATALAAWGIGTLTDGYMVIPTSLALSAMVFVLAVAWLRSRDVPPASDSTLLAERVMRGLLAVALIAIAVLPATNFGQPVERERKWRLERPTEPMWPRFWQQGWIGPDNDPTARSRD